jgi:hypothetical protein
LGPEGDAIRTRIAKKHGNPLDKFKNVSGEDKLRAFSLAGNIVKKPPRIGGRPIFVVAVTAELPFSIYRATP